MANLGYVARGTSAAGGAAVTPGLPEGVVDGDLLLLHIEGEGEDADADPAPSSDWTLVGSVASGTDGNAARTRHTVYWTRYNSANPPALEVPDAGEHTLAVITAWRDAKIEATTSNSWSSATVNPSYSPSGFYASTSDLLVASWSAGDDTTAIGSNIYGQMSGGSVTYYTWFYVTTTIGSDGTIYVGYTTPDVSANVSYTAAVQTANSEQWALHFIRLTPAVFAVGSAALGGLSASASFTVSIPQVEFSGSAPLGGLTATAAATVSHESSLAAPLGGVAAAASAVVSKTASLSSTLGGLTASASATVSHAASAAATIGSLSASAEFDKTVTATAEAALGELSASAIFSSTGAPIAVMGADLGGLDASASAEVEKQAVAAAPLGGLTATVEVTVTRFAAAASELGGVTATADAVITRTFSGSAHLGGVGSVGVFTVTPTVSALLSSNLGELRAVMAARRATSVFNYVANIYLGSDQVDRVYVGSASVWGG